MEVKSNAIHSAIARKFLTELTGGKGGGGGGGKGENRGLVTLKIVQTS